MTNEILASANKYAEGLKNVEHRRAAWIIKAKELKNHLKKIADELNETAAYKPGYYVDLNHAFNEETKGTCSKMPSVTFRSGSMPMLIEFKNSLGDIKDYQEKGFQIVFKPVITGHIMAILYPHHSELTTTEVTYLTLLVLDNIDLLTMDAVDQIISKGIEAAFYSSFTGMGEFRPAPEPQEDGHHMQIPPHNTIGFKRSETTEKVDEA